MFSIKLRLFGSLLAAGVITLVAGAAQAFEITQVINNVTECVDVFKAETSRGTKIQAYPCVGTKNEQWTLVKGQLEGTGNDGGVSTCMAAAGGTSGNVELEDCNSNPNTTWFIDNAGDIIIGNAGCLESQGSGAQLVVRGCTGEANQLWELRDVVIVQPLGANEHACVDIKGNSTANNTPVNAYPCTLGVNERWTYFAGALLGNGGHGSSVFTQTCLTESEGGVVVLQTCGAGSSQGWQTSNSGTVINGSGNCLDSKNGQNGDQLVDTACNPANNPGQVWVLQ